MKIISIIVIGFVSGVMLGFVITIPDEKKPKGTPPIGIESSKRIRGIVDTIDHGNKILIITHPSEYELNVSNKLKVDFGNTTNFSVGSRKADDDDIRYLWWSTEVDSLQNLQPGMEVTVNGTNEKKVIKVRSVNYKNPKNAINEGMYSKARGAPLTLRGIIDSFDKNTNSLVIKFKTNFTQNTMNRVRMYFDKETTVEKGVIFQEDGVAYFKDGNISSSISMLAPGKKVYIRYTTDGDRFLTTYILYGSPYPKI